jgi:hypothetical protein
MRWVDGNYSNLNYTCIRMLNTLKEFLKALNVLDKATSLICHLNLRNSLVKKDEDTAVGIRHADHVAPSIHKKVGTSKQR